MASQKGKNARTVSMDNVRRRIERVESCNDKTNPYIPDILGIFATKIENLEKEVARLTKFNPENDGK